MPEEARMSPSRLSAGGVMAPAQVSALGDHFARPVFRSGSRTSACAAGSPAWRFRGPVVRPRSVNSEAMGEDLRTTAVVQLFLNDLKGDSPAEPIVRELLSHAAG